MIGLCHRACTRGKYFPPATSGMNPNFFHRKLEENRPKGIFSTCVLHTPSNLTSYGQPCWVGVVSDCTVGLLGGSTTFIAWLSVTGLCRKEGGFKWVPKNSPIV